MYHLIRTQHVDSMSESHTSKRLTVYYISDPMCPWCWAFKTSWESLKDNVAGRDNVRRRVVLGGLAPDSDDPMTPEQVDKARNTWEHIHAKTGAVFNMDFWHINQPRKSTYPACRATIAAGLQRDEGSRDMFYAIQQAYYVDARNPADVDVLAAIATERGLDGTQLVADMQSEPVHARLTSDFVIRDRFQISGFPSIVLSNDTNAWALTMGYCDEATLISNWQAFERSIDEVDVPSGSAV